MPIKIAIEIPDNINLKAVKREAALGLVMGKTGFREISECEKLAILVLAALEKADEKKVKKK